MPKSNVIEIERPPLGLTPRWIWDEHRMKEIKKAMKRYTIKGKRIPQEWTNEYNELTQRKNDKLGL
jgi:hypothetical protein